MYSANQARRISCMPSRNDGPASSKPKTRAQLIKEAEELAGESENGKVAQGK